MKLILASQSPQRRQILEEMNLDFDVIPPDHDAEDAQKPNESPTELVRRLARQKAENVFRRLCEDVLVIGCDTVVVCRGEILGKPIDRDDAQRMLRLLQGERHQVLSGLCLLAVERRCCEVAATELSMQSLTEREIGDYLNAGLWEGKAGAFGYQDGHPWITIIEGSESNVIGLPKELLQQIIETWHDGGV